MQFVIKRDILLKSLNFVQGVVEKKNTLPILSNVLLQLNEDNQINSELSQLYQDLAILYAKNKNTDKALSSILKAIDLDPENIKNKEIKALLNQ